MFKETLRWKPWQLEGAKHLHRLQRGILNYPTGQGKCLTSLLSYHMLKLCNISQYKRAVIFAPTNAISAWEDAAEFLTASTAFYPGNVFGHEVVVISHSRAKKAWNELGHRFFAEACLIIDEVDALANDDTSFYTSMMTISKAVQNAWGLTATTIHNDLRNTYRFVDLLFAGQNPLGSIHNFCREHVTFQRKIVGKGRRRREIQEVSGYRNLPRLMEKMASFSVSCKVDVDVRFKYFLRDARPEEMNAIAKAGVEAFNSSSPASLIHGLQKVVDGCHVGQGISTKEQIFCELLDQVVPRGHPFIVYVAYHDVREMLLPLLKEYGVRVHEIYGAISVRDRRKVSQALRSGGNQCVLMTKAGIRGANLQFCESTIVYDCPTNVRDLIQLLGRQARLGSPFSRWYAFFCGIRGTIDEYKMMYISANSDTVRQVMESAGPLPFQTQTVTKEDIIRMRKSLVWKIRQAPANTGLAL